MKTCSVCKKQFRIPLGSEICGECSTNCPLCGKKKGVFERDRSKLRKGLCDKCYEAAQEEEHGGMKGGKSPAATLEFGLVGMKDSEHKACIDSLGLLEGEERRLQYVCYRELMSPPDFFGNRNKEMRKGLLVFTNDNVIFMQQEGAWSSNYSQALRIPLEAISGISEGGTLAKHLRILTGVGGSSECHKFLPFAGQGSTKEIRQSIQALITEVRQEKKQVALAALAKGTIPAMVFCTFCGARNRADQSRCANCAAPLTRARQASLT